MSNPVLDNEETMGKSVLRDENGSIKKPYQDPTNPDKFASAPNTSTSPNESNTGSGIENALGEKYSWETQAEDRANLDYEAAVLKSKNNFLENRKTIEANGIQNQEALTMQRYSQNQSNEKAGWTGGYVLDTERQMEYLKQTIQSQMYGQIELQKHGYDTSLAAARLAYETNKYDLALQYYEAAIKQSLTDAEQTGYYVSPEVKEMLNQYSIASQALNNNEDVERNEKILKDINDWFEANGISKEGVKTWARQQADRNWDLTIQKKYEELYAGAFTDDSGTQLNKDLYVIVDQNGDFVYADKNKTQYKTFNFEKATAEEVLDYINKDSTGTAKEQFFSRIDSISYEMELNFETHCTREGIISEKDKRDTETLVNELKNWLTSSKTIDAFTKEVQKFGDLEQAKELFGDYEVQIKLPNDDYVTLYFGPEDIINNPNNQNNQNNNEPTNEEQNSSITVYDKTYIKAGNLTIITDSKGEVIHDPSKESTIEKLPENMTDATAILKALEKTDKNTVVNTLTGQEDMQSLLDEVERALEGSENVGVANVAAPAAFATICLVAAKAGAAAGPYGWAVSAAALLVFSGASIAADYSTKDEAVKCYEDTSKIIADIDYAVGQENLTQLKKARDEYKALSEEQKNSLAEIDRQNYEKIVTFCDTYDKLHEMRRVASMYDTTLTSTDAWSYDYTQDKAQVTKELWKQGEYVASIGNGVVVGVAAVGETIVSAGKSIGKGAKKAWKKVTSWF